MYAVEQELCHILGAGVPELAPPHNKTFLSEVRPQLVLRLSVAGNGRTTLQRASTAATLHLAVLLCRLDVQETFGSYIGPQTDVESIAEICQLRSPVLAVGTGLGFRVYNSFSVVVSAAPPRLQFGALLRHCLSSG